MLHRKRKREVERGETVKLEERNGNKEHWEWELENGKERRGRRRVMLTRFEP